MKTYAMIASLFDSSSFAMTIEERSLNSAGFPQYFGPDFLSDPFSDPLPLLLPPGPV